MFPTVLVDMVQLHHGYEEIGGYDRSCQILIIANLLSRWIVIKDHKEEEDTMGEVLTTLLLRCGADSGIIQDKESLLELEKGFRKRLEERADLIEMLGM